MSMSNVISGFAATGIYPYNKNAAFAPSELTFEQRQSGKLS